MPEYTYERSNCSDGSVRLERWSKDGMLHRDNDKPAEICYHKDGSVYLEEWFKDGKRHRDNDKPAYIHYFKDGSVDSEHWYKYGVQYTPQKEAECKCV